MKVKPEFFLIKNNDTLYNKTLITGSDESFVSYIAEHIVRKFKNKNFHIDSSGEINKGLVGDLFSDKKILYVLRDYNFKNKIPEISNDLNQAVLISSTNNRKVNSLKAEFSKLKTSLLIECYPLSRASKEMVLRNFIETDNMQVSNDVFWYILESFENEYVLFVKQLQTISFIGKIDSFKDVEKAVFLENKIEINKIFFHIFKKNKTLVKIFNDNIYSQNDFNIFLNSIKLYLSLIINSSNKEEALALFPKYLFNEKDVFLKIYNLLNKKKIAEIYKNVLKAESLTRKNLNLYNAIGFRFLINTKKIIIS